jgi:hypothetical protein
MSVQGLNFEVWVEPPLLWMAGRSDSHFLSALQELGIGEFRFLAVMVNLGNSAF